MGVTDTEERELEQLRVGEYRDKEPIEMEELQEK
jgi:hypothetical protein